MPGDGLGKSEQARVPISALRLARRPDRWNDPWERSLRRQIVIARPGGSLMRMPTFRPIGRIPALAALTLAAWSPALAAAQATPMASPAAGAPPTAIVVSATNDPLRVAGSDGADHLEYDLVVTNVFTAPVALTSVEVVGQDGGTLLRLTGDALAEATQPLLGSGPTTEIAASATVAVVMDVHVPSRHAVDRLGHRIAYSIAPDAPSRSIIGAFAIDG